MVVIARGKGCSMLVVRFKAAVMPSRIVHTAFHETRKTVVARREVSNALASPKYPIQHSY